MLLSVISYIIYPSVTISKFAHVLYLRSLYKISKMALSDADVQKQIKHMMAFIEQVLSTKYLMY